MISSKALKDFVRLHEEKLKAKIDSRKAEKSDSELESMHWGSDCIDPTDNSRLSKLGLDATNQGRPRSRYFNYIMTATHN